MTTIKTHDLGFGWSARLCADPAKPEHDTLEIFHGDGNGEHIAIGAESVARLRAILRQAAKAEDRP